MKKILISLAILLASLVCQGGLRADSSVVLVNAPALFADALEQALAPWPIAIKLASSSESLGESMPGARASARAISEQHESQSVVWLTSNRDGHAIWMYDATDDRVVVRELLVSQTLDEAGAASAALSVKALLMHSHSAPASERFGATASVVPLLGLSPTKTWGVEGFLGLQQGFGSDALAQARIGVGLLYRHGPVELGARLSFGSGNTIRAPQFAGSFSEQELLLLLRYPISLGAYQLGPSLRASLERSSLQGTLVDSGRSVEESRLNPSLGLGIELIRDFDSLQLGVGLSSTYMLRSQRYLVAGSSVLDLSEIDMILGTSLVFWMP